MPCWQLFASSTSKYDDEGDNEDVDDDDDDDDKDDDSHLSIFHDYLLRRHNCPDPGPLSPFMWS